MHVRVGRGPEAETATPEVVDGGVEGDRPDRMYTPFGRVDPGDNRKALGVKLRQHDAPVRAADDAGHLGEYRSALLEMVKRIHQEHRAETARRERQAAPVCLNESDAADDSFGFGV